MLASAVQRKTNCWAGLACTAQEPCPIFLELSAVAPNGRKIAVAGNLHSDSTTIYSILLLSEDSGATWKEPAKRIRGASIDQLQFYDLQSGWAAGETLYPLPRDPFFLVTTDGGRVLAATSRYGRGGRRIDPALLVRFAQHGELIVDAGKSAGKRAIRSTNRRRRGELEYPGVPRISCP